jgi:hypothetical protein
VIPLFKSLRAVFVRGIALLLLSSLAPARPSVGTFFGGTISSFSMVSLLITHELVPNGRFLRLFGQTDRQTDNALSVRTVLKGASFTVKIKLAPGGRGCAKNPAKRFLVVVLVVLMK